MPQTCTICRRDKREEIDQALLSGEAYRSIAKRFGASPAAVFRHGKDHVAVSLVKAKGAAEEVQAGTLFERLRAINSETRSILKEARESQNHGIALQAIGRVEKQIELEARLLGELDESMRVAVGVHVGAPPEAPDAAGSFFRALSDEDLEKVEKAATLMANVSTVSGVKLRIDWRGEAT